MKDPSYELHLRSIPVPPWSTTGPPSLIDVSFPVRNEERPIGEDRGQECTDLRRDDEKVRLPHAIDLAVDLDTGNTGDGDQDHDSGQAQRERQWNLLPPFELNLPDEVDWDV